jgi:Flp pilus assembly protein TadD/ADP-heptose:LPS heptosyltransferase
MLDLADVTLLCADTANHALALRALDRSRADIRYGRVVLLTDAVPASVSVPAGIDVTSIATLRSREDYSTLVLKGLREHVPTSHVLVVQWDGYVVNPAAWDPAFLDTDFIGAKWFWFRDGMTIGNGGFSLRSRRLLDALQDPRIVLHDAEDLTIGRTYRRLLEDEHGIRFATEAQADRFAYEAAYPIGTPFGFHGLFNFARVVPADELSALAATFSDAIAGSPQLAQLVRNCIALGSWHAAAALAERRLAAVPDDAEARAQFEQARANASRAPTVGRNDPCPCGSGKRYKQCHGGLASATTPSPAGPDATALVARALAAHQRGALADAARDYRAALQMQPDHPVATHYLGVLAYQRGDLSTALPLLQRSTVTAPDEAEFHNNLGLALAAADRTEDAIAAYGRAVALRAEHATAWSNLGLAHIARNALEDAEQALRRAIALQPEFAAAHWNLALALLARGCYAEGWKEYEWRLRVPEFRADAVSGNPRWSGEPLQGRSILLVAEQGLGDTLHFVRYAAALARDGAEVTVRVPARLARLAATAPGVARISVQDEAAPPCDFQLPLLSLPGMLSVNAPLDRAMRFPYLATQRPLRHAVGQKVRRIAGNRRAVGLAWSGAQRNTNDRRRSMPLRTLAPLLERSDVAWFSLQHDDDRDVAGVPAAQALHRLPERIAFDGMAALIDTLDLIICVDTSVAHVAGALDKPVWILLAHAPDWRWGLEGDTTAWYPSARLFRQPAPGQWDSVVQRIGDALPVSP